MKSFFFGLLIGAMGGIVGGYFSFNQAARVKELSDKNEELRKEAGEAKAGTEAAREKLAAAEDREIKARQYHDQELKKLRDAHEAEKEGLQREVAAAKRDADEFRKKMGELKEETVKIRDATKSVPVIAKLVSLRDVHRPVQIAVARDLNEVRMLLLQAKESPPRVGELRLVAKRLSKKSADLGESLRRLYSYVSRNSTALKEAGVNPVTQMADLSSDEYKLVEAAADAVIEAVEGIRFASSEISAEKMEWQDCDVSARPGDCLYVKGGARSSWKTVHAWGAKRGEDAIAGWERETQSKLLPEARAGALIMRIGFSDNMWPAYLRKPIIADATGTVACRMNDTRPDGNWGRVFIEVTAVPGEKVGAALSAIDEALKGVGWLKW